VRIRQKIQEVLRRLIACAAALPGKLKMLRPHRVLLYLLNVALFVGVHSSFRSLSHADVHARQKSVASLEEELKRGVELYEQGDDNGAIKALLSVTKQRKDIITAWHYLGLAYERLGKTKDARKSYERAVAAGEMTLEAVFSTTPYAEVREKVEHFKPLLMLAAESANKYLALSPNLSSSKVKEWNSRAETLLEYTEVVSFNQSDSSNKIYMTDEVTTRARITQKVEPSYTEEARKNQVSGVVVLRVVFALDGKVRGIRIIQGLPYGLTYRAVEAARKIKFIPAIVNGQPVSQFTQIEYNFNLY
jgi:TonB family protein